MPGVDLDIDLPSASDNYSAALAKTITALSTIIDDLEARVVPSELDVNAALSMAGNSLLAVGSVQMMSGNAPTAAGSIYYHTDGEFYMRTAAGAVKVTANGSVNVTGSGGFTGDYGLGDETASYSAASQTFTFTSSSGVFADLEADDLVLHSASGSVRFAVDNAITTARQLIVKDIPASGVSALVYNASNSTLESAENQRVTNTFKATDVDITGNLLHGERSFTQGFEGSFQTAGSFSSAHAGPNFFTTYTLVTGTTIITPILAPLVAGVSRVKRIEIVHENATVPTLSLRRQQAHPSNTGSNVGNTQSTSTSGSFAKTTITISVPADGKLAAGERFQLSLANAVAGDFDVHSITTIFDAVA